MRIKFLTLVLAVFALASCKPTEKQFVIETTQGNITVKLYNETPKHRDNFVKLAKSGYYDGVIFHRVIKDFMIQGGDPDSKNPQPDVMYGRGGPSYTVPAEFVTGLYHKKGALAAARTDNPEKASSGSQFYIVQGRTFTTDELKAIEAGLQKANPQFKFTPEEIETYTKIGGTPFLDSQYTVYGEVTEGLDIIDKIATMPTLPGDRPEEDVVILSIKQKK